MNGYYKYLKWLGALVLVFLPTFCLAALDVPSSPLWDMFQNLSFTPPGTDVSVGFLAKMFGAVPGADQFAGAGTTILGVVFGVFNTGVLALSGVFLSYTITKILTETTMDGAAMGKSTTIWTAVRCALSSSLLVPSASGYSLLNGIVMWVVIQSVGLADLTWSSALKYMQAGGAIVSIPTTKVVDYTLVDYTLDASGVSQAVASVNASKNEHSIGSSDVLRSLACANVVRNTLLKSQQTQKSSLEDNPGVGHFTQDQQQKYMQTTKAIPEKGDVFSLYKNDGSVSCQGSNQKYSCTAGQYIFPYIKNEETNPLKDYGLNIDDTDIPKLSGVCGKIPYANSVSNVTQDSDDYKVYMRYAPVKQQALENMITTLSPTAKDLVNKISKNSRGERQLDPLQPDMKKSGAFKVFTDDSGKDIGLLIDPGKGDPERWSRSNVTDQYYGFLQKVEQNQSSLPGLNFPPEAASLLAAAVNYQEMLSPAQNAGQAAVNTDNQARFDQAIKIGWSGAGAYPMLLRSANQTATQEFKYYHLSNDAQARSKNPPNTMFDIDDVRNKLKAVDPSSNKDESVNNLDLALNWIWLTTPYAKIQGQSLVNTSGTSTAGGLTSALQTGGIIGQRTYLQLMVLSGKFASNQSSSEEASIKANQTIGVILLPIAPPGGMAILATVPLSWLTYDMSKVLYQWMISMFSQNDPILKLQILGDKMMEASTSYMLQLINYIKDIAIALSTASLATTVLGAILAPGSIFGATTGGSIAAGLFNTMFNTSAEMSQTIIFMYVPLGLAVMGPIFVTGAIFSIYVPMIPYLLFLFGVISWIISVLTLMAAAPIICFLMLWGNSSQENPLLAREAEQFVTQLIGMFFRPTLMIIGFIAGMVISYVAIDLLNFGVASMFEMIAGADWITRVGKISMAGITDPVIIVDMIKIGAVLVVYTFAMMSLVNISFSPIHMLYSEAMRAAGISAIGTGMEEKYLGEVKQGVQQYAEAASSGMKETATSLKGIIKEGPRAKLGGKSKKPSASGVNTPPPDSGGSEGGSGSATGTQ